MGGMGEWKAQESRFGLPCAVEAIGCSDPLYGTRWNRACSTMVSGLELSFEIYAGFFLSKGVTYIDEGLLDLPVMKFRQMGHSCCTQPEGCIL